jgi:hypothetical protein
VVKDLALASLGLGDKALVEDGENILADLLELELNLLAVLANDTNVLVGALSLLLLLDAGDDAPGSTAGADDVLVGDGKEVALVDCELTADLNGQLLVDWTVIIGQRSRLYGRVLVGQAFADECTFATSYFDVSNVFLWCFAFCLLTFM